MRYQLGCPTMHMSVEEGGFLAALCEDLIPEPPLNLIYAFRSAAAGTDVALRQNSN
jgi:hypothetical protein